MDRKAFDGLAAYDIEVTMLMTPGGHVDDTYIKKISAICWRCVDGFVTFSQHDGTESDIVCLAYVHSIEIIKGERNEE